MSERDPKEFDLTTDHPEAHAFIQWKGTDVCMDFRCDCGDGGHFDGFFAYAVKCPGCGSIWEMPSHLFPRKVAAHECLVTLDADEDE